MGQEAEEHAPAVKRQHRQQIQGHQNDIDVDTDLRHLHPEPFVQADGQQNADHEGPGQRLKHVGYGAGEGDPQHVLLGLAQPAEIHRHGLCPAKQQGGAAKQARRDQDANRHQKRSDRIDVAHGIQAHPSRHCGGHVAEVACHVTVRRLVQRNGKNDRNRINRQGLDEFVHGASSPSRRGSPRPTRNTAGAPADKSTTVVGSIGHGPASMMAASTWA